MSKTPLIVLTGPTGVGKTKLSISLAKKIGGEIISADSMQVYRYMDIGSAKITPEEMQGVKHHLIDIIDPTDDFNVVIFKQKVVECINDIVNRGAIPIMVGGTGFYIQAVLNDIDFSNEDAPGEIRLALEEKAKLEGNEALYEELKSVDPESAESIHPNNVKRVIRALEFYKTNGYKISDHNKTEREKTSAYNSAYFVLTNERSVLYENIEKRVDKMVDAGLLDEVKKLHDMGCRRGMTSMQGLGYKEILDYLDGIMTFDEAVSKIKLETRHFAKRQLTWFNREEEVIWLDKSKNSEDELLNDIVTTLKERNII